MADLIQCSRDEGVYRVQLVDDEGRNALSEALVTELEAALADVGADDRVMLLLGLPDVFCSGADLELLRRLSSTSMAPADIALAGSMLAVPIPVIAAAEGHAVGGGLALAFCADILLLAEESRYGASFANLGFTPGMGVTRLLEHALSPAMAHELLYTGELRRGAELRGSGVNYVLPRPEVRPKAEELARRIADKPRRVLELLKRTLSAPRRAAFEHSRTTESLMHELCFADPDTGRRIEEGWPW